MFGNNGCKVKLTVQESEEGFQATASARSDREFCRPDNSPQHMYATNDAVKCWAKEAPFRRTTLGYAQTVQIRGIQIWRRRLKANLGHRRTRLHLPLARPVQRRQDGMANPPRRNRNESQPATHCGVDVLVLFYSCFAPFFCSVRSRISVEKTYFPHSPSRWDEIFGRIRLKRYIYIAYLTAR